MTDRKKTAISMMRRTKEQRKEGRKEMREGGRRERETKEEEKLRSKEYKRKLGEISPWRLLQNKVGMLYLYLFCSVQDHGLYILRLLALPSIPSPQYARTAPCSSRDLDMSTLNWLLFGLFRSSYH